MMNHPHSTQLLDRAEIERAISRAKALRAETFRTSCAAMIGFVCTLVSTIFTNLAKLRGRAEHGERVHILTQTKDAASRPASAR